ncbi:ABC transporter permease [Lacticaseibacillus baoqingensis]|uniref:ABC transporter permease n=1 Tax=Lacticaseibacillus baoqingensis TaxID=2486013 RepID=A0ABW4E4G6_9LACO|nr:ABC transporter permease [Lacticaseibacillus baoqingensis]
MLKANNKVLVTISAIVLFFLIAPLIMVIITAFGTDATIAFPIHGFTLHWFANVFAQPDFVAGFKMSLIIALAASLLALVIGVPLVYALTRYNVHHQAWFQTLFLSPTFIPEIVIGFALYQGLVITVQLPLLLTLLIGHFLLCLPYVVRLVTASMVLMDEHIEEAAWVYGSSRLKAFLTVTIPNIRASLVAAFMLCFINSFNNIPISLFLNGPDLSMLPTAILNYLQNNYDPTVSAISVLLMLFTAAMMLLVEKGLGLKALNEM